MIGVKENWKVTTCDIPGALMQANINEKLFLKFDGDLVELLVQVEPTNRILSKVQKSFWSCTHVNSCQKYTLYINLHILLNILS